MIFLEKNIKKIALNQSLFLSWKAFKYNGRKFSFTDDEIQLLLEVCIEYKAEYCSVDWESVRSKYEQIQGKLIQQYPKNSTDGFPNSENAEQTLTMKRIGGKPKTIRINLKKAVDTNKRSGG